MGWKRVYRGGWIVAIVSIVSIVAIRGGSELRAKYERITSKL